jgi:hypothetical protein
MSSSIAPALNLRWDGSVMQIANAPAAARYVFAQRAILVNDLEQVGRVVTAAPGGNGALAEWHQPELALDEALLGFDPERVDRLVLRATVTPRGGLALLLGSRRSVRVYAFQRSGLLAWVESIDMPSGTRRDEPVEVTGRMSTASACGGAIDRRRADRRRSAADPG